MFNWYKKEKPFFTGIARGVGGFGFGASAAGAPVPSGPKQFWEFKVWGAGGGGNGNTDNYGGGGAYITGQYQIAPNTTITLVVGSRSVWPVGLNVAVYGGGGPKGSTYNYGTGTGGGMSGVFLTNGDPVFETADSPSPAGTIASRPYAGPTVQPGATVQACLIAAAGGGACVDYASDAHGGGGGVTAGGSSSNTDPAGGGVWNGEGTDTGSGGASDPPGYGGALFYGGNSNGGGGGGGGFYGGGGGGNSSEVSGGGGGASYYKTTQPAPAALLGYNPGSHSASADGVPGDTGAYPTTSGYAGNRSDPLNNGSYGSGGTQASGQNGMIAYRRADSYNNLPSASWNIVTHVGSDQTISTGDGLTTGDGI